MAARLSSLLSPVNEFKTTADTDLDTYLSTDGFAESEAGMITVHYS